MLGNIEKYIYFFYYENKKKKSDVSGVIEIKFEKYFF